MEAVLLFNREGEITYCNDAAKKEFGELNNFGNDNVSEMFPNVFKLQGKELKVLEQDIINKDTECTYYETFAYRRNQTCYPVRLKVVLPSDKSDKLGICYAFNISKEKQALKREQQAKEELKKAINIKNEFLANITHELRTPINGIRGLANNLQDTNLSSKQIEEVNLIIRSCDNMVKVVNEILDFSKITAGKLELEKREFDFKDFIHSIISLHISAVQEKGLKLILNIGSNVPSKVVGDEYRLGQIINNLLSNAVKFTTIGQITFEIMNTYISPDEVELFFLIVDSGIGISKEEMDKLFISFSQVDGSITRRFGGTGLGLVISKRLVELMGGSIHVDSMKGKGSAFSFSIRLGLRNDNTVSNDKNMNPDWDIVEAREEDFNAGHVEGDAFLLQRASLPLNDENNDTEERLRVMRETLEKLMLCVELGNWEKAEKFAGIIKNLFAEANLEGRRITFRLELSIRKEDYDATMERVKDLQNFLAK